MKSRFGHSLAEHIRHTGSREILSGYLQILAGCVLGAAAYPAFLVPNNIAPGGLTGVATILNYLFHWPVGTVSLLMNIPLFIIGYRSMGKVFAFRSLIATILFSVLIDVLPIRPVSTDPLLGTLFGGVVLGVRPQHLQLDDNGVEAFVDVSEMMGSELHLHMDRKGTDMIMVIPTAELTRSFASNKHERIGFSFSSRLMNLFDAETGMSLLS